MKDSDFSKSIPFYSLERTTDQIPSKFASHFYYFANAIFSK